MSWSPTDNQGAKRRLPSIFPAIGEPQGKVGKKVYLRSWTGDTVYARDHPDYPRRRTEAQRRTMKAMQSAAPAWRRLTPLEQDIWRDDPPIRTMSRRNRGAWSKHATGWNWFIGLYLKEAQTMQFAAAETNTPIVIPAGSSRTPARYHLARRAPHQPINTRQRQRTFRHTRCQRSFCHHPRGRRRDASPTLAGNRQPHRGQ